MVATRLRGACRRFRLRAKGSRRDTATTPTPKGESCEGDLLAGGATRGCGWHEGRGEGKGGARDDVEKASQQGRMCGRVTSLLETFLATLRACARMASLPNSSEAREMGRCCVSKSEKMYNSQKACHIDSIPYSNLHTEKNLT